TGALGGAVGGITSGIVNGVKKLTGDKQSRDFDELDARANPLVSVLGKDAGEFATDVLKTGALGGAVGGITSGIVNGVKKLTGDKQSRGIVDFSDDDLALIASLSRRALDNLD
ncbi:hypothetical protein FA95DRAFT_1602877, partial [Auriscalpium vulgare]